MSKDNFELRYQCEICDLILSSDSIPSKCPECLNEDSNKFKLLSVKGKTSSQTIKLTRGTLEFDKEDILIKSESGLLYKDTKTGDWKVNIDGVADRLILNYHFKTIFGNKSDELYVYENGIYVPKGREVVKVQSEKLLGKFAKNSILNEIVEKIKRLTAINREDFEVKEENLICLQNGIYDLTNNELSNFMPKYYFKTKLPISYDKNADCPKIKSFFETCLYPQDIPVIQEWFGYLLYRRYFIKKAIIAFGQKDTGKTIFINLQTAFLGLNNISGISLQRIAMNDKFAMASLNNKFANLYDDLSAKDISDNGGFKIATGGGYMTAEQKFGDPFQFLNYAKHTFACNKIPSIKDCDDEAYFFRWLLIPFDNQVSEDEKDPFLIKKLTTSEELSGLFNWALEGLSRLLKNNKFSYNLSLQEIKAIMLRNSNPLNAFTTDCLNEKVGSKISKEAMYQIYCNYARKKGYQLLSKEQLGRQLNKHAPYLVAKNNSQERYWDNVGLNPNSDTFDTSQNIIREFLENENKGLKNNDMIFSDVSKVSKNNANDTLDTFLSKDKEDNPYGFSEVQE